MLTPLFIAYLAVLNQDATPPTTASGLVSRMLARYTSAKTLSGTIHTAQTAGNVSVVTDTSIAYERPSRIRLDQHQKSNQIDKSRLLVSDGSRFAYTPPERVLGATPFLLEPVKPEGREAQTVGDLYSVVAADLPDRSPVLDVLIARPDDMRYFANQLAQFRLVGKESVNGTVANVIEGAWRESDAVLPSGRFKIYVTDMGDLVRYVLTQNFSPPPTPGRANSEVGGAEVTVVTTWDTKIEVNGAVKPENFVLRAP